MEGTLTGCLEKQWMHITITIWTLTLLLSTPRESDRQLRHSGRAMQCASPPG